MNPGPESCWKQLDKEIQQRGIDYSEIKAVLNTHVHLDHCGGSWRFAEKGVPIYVHPIGAPHIENPSRLWESAGRIYGPENMEPLWGQAKNTPASLVNALSDGETLDIAGVKIKVIFSPGHTNHHVSFLFDDHYISGDLLGVAIENGPITVPAPPPDVDLKLWGQSIKEAQKIRSAQVYLTHFDKAKLDMDEQCERTLEAIDHLKNWLEKTLKAEKDKKTLYSLMDKEVERIVLDSGGSEELARQYLVANPPFMSIMGYKRYFEKHLGMQF